MATIIEHDIQRDNGTAASLIALVALTAIFIVLGTAMYVLRVFPFNTRALADVTTTPSENVSISDTLPSSNPLGQ